MPGSRRSIGVASGPRRARGRRKALLDAATGSTIGTYITDSLLTGARTEELRALTWSKRRPRWQTGADVPVLPHMRVWRSVRAGGETKIRSSRRTLALPHRAIVAFREQHDRQTDARQRAGARWADHDLVFASANGAALDSANVRRGLRNIAAAGGLDPDAWTPRELRHSFVSLLSDEGVRSNRSPG